MDVDQSAVSLWSRPHPHTRLLTGGNIQWNPEVNAGRTPDRTPSIMSAVKVTSQKMVLTFEWRQKVNG